MQNDSFPYQKEWQAYRKLRNKFYLISFLGVLIIFLIGFIFSRVVSFSDSQFIGLAAVLFMLWGYITTYWHHKVSSLKCPKCHEKFFLLILRGTEPLMMQHYCNNCGLPKYSGSTFYKPENALSLLDKDH
jgi:hypothetical protein